MADLVVRLLIVTMHQQLGCHHNLNHTLPSPLSADRAAAPGQRRCDTPQARG